MAETSKTTMYEDLVKFQANLPHIKKESSANYGRYASLDLIHDKVLPILTKYNLAWVTLPSVSELGEPTLKYRLYHTSGEVLSGEMKLYLTKQDAQGQGSAITYAKRYAICAVLGLTPDDDDDGQAASKFYTNTLPSVVEDLPVKQVDEDVDESVGVDIATIGKLYGALKLKGITAKTEANNVLNNLAKTQYQTDQLVDLSEVQALQLYAYLCLPATNLEALKMLSEES